MSLVINGKRFFPVNNEGIADIIGSPIEKSPIVITPKPVIIPELKTEIVAVRLTRTTFNLLDNYTAVKNTTNSVFICGLIEDFFDKLEGSIE